MQKSCINGTIYKYMTEFSRDMNMILEATKAAYDVRVELGDRAKEKVSKNQFGDMAMKADLFAEQEMQRVLQGYDLNALIIGEEVGEQRLAGSVAQRLVVMDGLDGSDAWPDMGGSMIALFEHANNPRYKDVVAAAISLDSMKKIIVAGRGLGAFAVDLSDPSRSTRLRTSDQGLDMGRIFVDEDPTYKGTLEPYFAMNKLTFGDPLRRAGFSPERLGSSAWHYALLALGKASLVGESTRKKNLELPTGFLVVTEAGGQVVDVNTGKSIGDEQYHVYGQTEHKPFMMVANDDVKNKYTELRPTA